MTFEDRVVAFYLGQPDEVDAEAVTCAQFGIDEHSLQFILEADLVDNLMSMS